MLVAGHVLMVELGARLVPLGAVPMPGLSHAGWAGYAVLATFAVVRAVWPLVGARANALAMGGLREAASPWR